MNILERMEGGNDKPESSVFNPYHLLLYSFDLVVDASGGDGVDDGDILQLSYYVLVCYIFSFDHFFFIMLFLVIFFHPQVV